MPDALSAAVTALGLRLQAILDGLPGLTEESSAFLRRLPAPGPEQTAGPLQGLAAGLRLTPLEVELLLLAGMPEEHEGYAALLRQIHPQGEPRPTVGLAARLLCRGDEERSLLRAIVERGAAVRSGALVVGGDSPFFERSLLLGDALWSALHGVDAWPRSARARREPPAVAGLDEWLPEPPPARAVAAVASRRPSTPPATPPAPHDT